MLAARPRQVLFIAHEASISGAPVLLLNLLLLLEQQEDIRFYLVLARGGPFLETYRGHFPVMVMKPQGYGKEKTFTARLVNILRNRVRIGRLLAKAWKADIIFSNTVVNGRLLRNLYPFRNKMVCYAHELANTIAHYPVEAGSSLTLCRLFACPSAAVQHVLQYQYGIAADKLYRLSYYFPVDDRLLMDTAAKQQFIRSFRERFKLGNDFVVGGMGTICKRKGTDFFLDVCEQVAKVHPDIRFCWIGSFENEETRQEILAQAAAKQIEQQVVFTGVMPHHYYNLAAFDLFFLSSREDPYPLVVLEAGFMQVPAICFAASGGITEFVENDAGWIIGGFSIAEAATTIIDLYNHREYIAEKGRTAYRKSIRLHADPNKVLKEFYDVIGHIQ